MKTLCTKSNILFLSPGFQGLRTKGEHPIFSASTQQLLLQFPAYSKGLLSESEQRLLFLALLNKTKLFIFDHPAEPSVKTISSNIELLIRTLDWVERSSSYSFSLPSYRIDRHSKDLRNVNNWIYSWIEAKDNWLDRQDKTKNRTEFLRAREDTLNKLIHSTYKNVENYNKKLAAFCADTCEMTDPAIRKHWVEMFTLKEPQLFDYPTETLQKFYNYLKENLPIVDSLIAQTALRHIYTILHKNTKGILYALTDDEDMDDMIADITNPQTYAVIPRTQLNDAILVRDAPENEPKEKDYPTRVAYLVASAKYSINLRRNAEIAIAKATRKAAVLAFDAKIIAGEEYTTDKILDTSEIEDFSEEAFREQVDILSRTSAELPQEKFDL